PLSGISNLFSKARAWNVARALLAASVVAWLTVRRLEVGAADLAHAVGNPAAAALRAGMLARRLAPEAILVGLVLGALGLLVTRRSWIARHRMTKDEVKREHRESEGDPQLKAARERAHHEMLAAATINAVRDATVVVVNPEHLATALKYRE